MSEPVKYRTELRPCVGSLRYLFVGVMLIGIGIALGGPTTRPSAAWGDVIDSSPQQHYHNSSQLSLPVLQDISATLHQIDGRLGRLEAAAKQWQTTRVSSPAK
jgi:hypothetical protein